MSIPLHEGAAYTMTLRQVDQLYDIGLMDYPIFDEGYRAPLRRKIVDHFWLREIGQETPDMFIFFLNRTMREIMPPINEVYRSQRWKYDPMSTIDLATFSENTGTTNQSGTQNGTSDTKGNASSRVTSQEFPQTMLAENKDYATTATDSVSTSDTTATNQATSANDTTTNDTGKLTNVGRNVPGAVLLQAYRDAIVNTDMMVLNQLEPLFMQLWHNGDTRSTPNNPFMWSGYGFNSGILY